MSFAVQITQWRTVADFVAHVKTINRPSFAPDTLVDGVVVHHTWKPTLADWRGETTMNGMLNYYKRLGWNAGPHLFIAIGSPNIANDGIWQMTPLTTKGIHAGECNNTKWGIEVVGNYDIQPWSSAMRSVVYDVVAELMRKAEARSISLRNLKGHRECNSPKSCPGKMIDMNVVRDDVQAIMFPTIEIVSRDSAIIAPARCTQQEAVAYLSNRNGWYTTDELKNIIIPAYFEYGAISGVDPCVAIAQLVHETGYLTSWWSNRPRRNPAGIGVTGQTSATKPPDSDLKNWAYNAQTKRWQKGLSFREWKDVAIPAHMARLLAYAVKPEKMTAQQIQFVQTHTASRPVPSRIVGCAPTLAGLEGTWAYPGKGYADKLSIHANNIIRMA